MADKNMIELIKALRERTGAGMMDCKHALEATGGDIEKAIDLLREKGIAKAAQRASRTADEGSTFVKISEKGNKGAVIEINCETDFVAASDKFKALVAGTMETILKNDPKTLDEAHQLGQRLLDDTALAVGEKLDFRRFALLRKSADQGFGSYIHMGGKISVLVVLEKNDPELANQIAMHIAANSPLYLEMKDIPLVDRERELGVAKAEVAADPKLISKPAAVKEQISQRKVDKVLSLSCLYDQIYLLDETKPVRQVLAEKGNKVMSFIRYQVGEGLAQETNQK
jgi:elongation factor Ts